MLIRAACHCLILKEFGLVVGVGADVFVARLLQKEFCVEQLGHCGETVVVRVAVEAQVLLRLGDALSGNAKVLIRLLDIIPQIVEVDAEQLFLVELFKPCVVEFLLLALDGV